MTTMTTMACNVENRILVAASCPTLFFVTTSFEVCWKETGTVVREQEWLQAMQQAVLAQDEEFQRRFHARLIRKIWTVESKQAHELYIHQLTVTDWQECFVETLRQLGRLK